MPEKVTGGENLRKRQDMISEGTRGAFYVKSGQQTSYQADRDGVNRLSMTDDRGKAWFSSRSGAWTSALRRVYVAPRTLRVAC